MRKLFITLTFLSLVFTSQGCALLVLGFVAGASGVAYVKGSLEKNFDKPVSVLHKASLASLKNMKMTILSDTTEQHNSHIVAEDHENKKITIDITALTEKSCKIQIRVGIFGDQIRSQMILNNIQKRL